MKRLIEAGLSGAGLIEVHTPELVRRYNEALERLGIKPTALESFQIDGIGWSPEIADEKKDYCYLLAGGANQFGIILTPDQEKKPIYVPYMSYLRRLLRDYFKKFRNEITDITTTHPLTINIDPEVSRYTNPRNLLLVDFMVVHSDAGALITAAGDQRTLAETLQGKNGHWFETDLRIKLAESGKQYGDLRFRSVEIRDYRFSDMDCFQTEAFGGVFVLRSKDQGLLVLAGEKTVNEYQNEEEMIFAISSPQLPELLLTDGWVDVDLSKYTKHRDELQDMRECLINTLVLEADPTIPVGTASNAHKQSIIGNLDSEKTALLEELEWLLKRFENGKSIRKSEIRQLSPSLKLLLMRPRGGSDAKRETVELLLSQLRSYDPLEIYRADKNRFMREYGSWSREKREWAIARILKHYVPIMNT